MEENKLVLRSRWTAFGSTILAVASLITLSMLFTPYNSAAFTVVTIAVGVLLGLMAIRVGISCVVITRDLVDVRGPLRRRRYEKSQILEFRLEPLEEKLTLSSWAPVLCQKNEHLDELHLLAGYSSSDEVPNRRVKRQYEILAEWLKN